MNRWRMCHSARMHQNMTGKNASSSCWRIRLRTLHRWTISLSFSKGIFSVNNVNIQHVITITKSSYPKIMYFINNTPIFWKKNSSFSKQKTIQWITLETAQERKKKKCKLLFEVFPVNQFILFIIRHEFTVDLVAVSILSDSFP